MTLPPGYYNTRFILDSSAFPEPFAIITAWNPMDETLPLAENHGRDVELRNLIASFGMPHFRATGCSPDRSHSEPGWAAVLDFEQARAISLHFRQRAFWWIERDELYLVPSDSGLREALGPFATRVVTE